MPTKKAAKKAVTKKTTAKKVPTKNPVAKGSKKTTAKKTAPRKQVSTKPLVFADDQRSFWVTNGQILNSLVALRDALHEMEKDVYLYHATGDQNDFAAWVDQVLCDPACAQDLSRAKTQKSAQTVVVRHLKLYSL